MAKKSEDQRLESTAGSNTIKPDHETTSSNKYKGVRKRKWGKWVSEIRLPNSRERIWLGSYDTPEKAARAFDAAQFCLRGPSANFNFPENPPDIPGGRSMSPAEIQSAAANFANSVTAAAEAEEEEEFYSPSTISDEPTVQMECDVAGADASFHISLSLAGGFGSGNFASDFGLYNGFDDFTAGEYYSPQPSNFDYDDDSGGCGGDSFLWNF